MTDLVPTDQIEATVGRPRHADRHLARAVSAERRVYLLHPTACLGVHGDDLRMCPYSLALDEGIDVDEWVEDTPMFVEVHDSGRLVPEWRAS